MVYRIPCEAEVSLLKKGLNFSVTPANVPATEITTTVESAVRPLDAKRADTVRRADNTILQQAKPTKPNITREQQDALKSLKEDNSIMVLPPDKGRASVVLDADKYHGKMAALSETGCLTRKLSEKLLILKRNGHISQAVYNKIRPRHNQLTRTHKANAPLRPIVSRVNTFAYALSAFLATIWSPLTGNSDFTVTNSAHFESTIGREQIHNHEIIVSFDVQSLFAYTYAPIEGTVQAALQKQENDADLVDRTTLTSVQIADFLVFV